MDTRALDTLVGTKRGMTQTWTADGQRLPVTVIELGPNTVVAVRSKEKEGYEALQLGFGTIRTKLLSKAVQGHYAKAGVAPHRHLREVRATVGEHKAGEVLNASLFPPGTWVDVIGTSKGKGFQGTVKLHKFSRGPEGHGSDNVRKPGSIGMHTHPGRVLKGKRMASRMGNERVTVHNLAVIQVDAEKHRLLVAGPVPGNTGSLVLVRKSRKQPAKAGK
jgi:large subunit ribosomal protein L3